MNASSKTFLIILTSMVIVLSCRQQPADTSTQSVEADSMKILQDTTIAITGKKDPEVLRDKETSENNEYFKDNGTLKSETGRPEEVLGTLQLYRAKRYESVTEAVNARDTVYKLILYGQKLGKISPDIARLKYLNSLDMAYNVLTEIPADIKGLKYLQGLYVNGNQINYIPEFVYDFKYLYRLDVSENLIDEVSPEIQRLSELTVLNLGSNRLTKIPAEIYNLNLLTALYLNNNRITELPEGISNLTHLTRLRLEYNQLTDLPGDLEYMTQLKELWVHGNAIPDDIIEVLQEKLPSTKIRY